MIKTLAEFRRRLQPGTRLRMVQFNGTICNKLRVVAEVNTEDITFTGDDIPAGEKSYLQFPKRREITFTEDGFSLSPTSMRTLRYLWEDEVGLTAAEAELLDDLDPAEVDLGAVA